MLIVTQRDGSFYHPPSNTVPQPDFTMTQWSDGLRALFSAVRVSGMKKVVLGDIPLMPERIPFCLARNTTDVQSCSSPRSGGFAYTDQRKGRP